MQFDSQNRENRLDVKKDIKRYFYSTGKCNAGCKYCFAHHSNYSGFEHFSSKTHEIMGSGFNIVYPSCDGEFFNNPNVLEQLDIMRKNASCKNLVFSIATKGVLDEKQVKRIALINNEMIGQNKGFIKVSVTITNQSMINELEPNTCSFAERINNLEMLKHYNIPTSVIIKPLFPFIDIKEYIDIIRSTSKYNDLYLTGELYIDPDSDFHYKYIKGRYHIDLKTVEWLDNKKMYRVIESNEKQDKIKGWVSELYNRKGVKLNLFEDDPGLLLFIKNRIETQKMTRDNLKILNSV